MSLDDLALPDDIVEILNAGRGGFNEALGLEIVSVKATEIVGELTIGPQHAQPYGIVHGGVYSSMIETLASVGAALHAMTQGKHCVGLENSTSFLRATRGGKLRGTAVPLVAGRRTHVWEVTVIDETRRAVATGRVRLILISPETPLAGKQVPGLSSDH